MRQRGLTGGRGLQTLRVEGEPQRASLHLDHRAMRWGRQAFGVEDDDGELLGAHDHDGAPIIGRAGVCKGGHGQESEREQGTRQESMHVNPCEGELAWGLSAFRPKWPPTKRLQASRLDRSGSGRG